eukprot:265611-Hanusia_phi.AAC.3
MAPHGMSFDYSVERGLMILHRMLLSSEFYPIVQETFFRGHIASSDVMLETERAVIRKEEVLNLKEYIASRERGLLSLHLGAEYSDYMRRERISEGFRPVYRIFSLDLDCKVTGEAYFTQQAFMAGLYGVSMMQRFMDRLTKEVDLMVCFTGGGWHVYFASERLARQDSQGRAVILQNLQRESVFSMRRDGTFARNFNGHLVLRQGVSWKMGDLVHTAKDGTVRDVWECRREAWFLIANEDCFLRAAPLREKDWLAPGGPVSSILFTVQPLARSVEVSQRLASMVEDLEKGRVRVFSSLMAAVARVMQLAAVKEEDALTLGSSVWLRAVVMYACISHDCCVSGMHLDHHTRDSRQMLRAPLSAKVKSRSWGEVTSYISLPLGSPGEAVRRTWEGGHLEVTGLEDSLLMREQPVLEAALRHFYGWARRVSASIAAASNAPPLQAARAGRLEEEGLDDLPGEHLELCVALLELPHAEEERCEGGNTLLDVVAQKERDERLALQEAGDVHLLGGWLVLVPRLVCGGGADDDGLDMIIELLVQELHGPHPLFVGQ